MTAVPRTVKTDAELLQAFRHYRDEGAFCALVERHGALMQLLAERRLDDPGNAPDVVVRAFAILAGQANRAPDEGLAGWLAGIVRHLCATENRASRRRHAREVSTFRNALQDRSPMNPQSLDLSHRLDDLILKLKPEERESLLMHAAEGLTFREIGERQGISEDAARMRTNRAIDRVRRKLGISSAGVAQSLHGLAAPPLSATESERIARAALAVPAGTAGGGLALGLILMTTTQRTLLGLTALLLLGAGTTGALALRNSGSSAASGAPIAPVTANILSPLAGEWRGTMTYVDARTGRREPVPADVSLILEEGAMQIRLDYVGTEYDEKGRLRFPNGGREIVWEDDKGREPYRLVSVEPGSISGVHTMEDERPPLEERVTIARRGEGLSIVFEQKPQNGGTWTLSKEHRLERKP